MMYAKVQTCGVRSIVYFKFDYLFKIKYLLLAKYVGLSKKVTCLRGRVAVWPRGRVAEIDFC